MMTCIIMIMISCGKKAPVATRQITDEKIILSPEEKAKGVMTPEILWKFRRLGTAALSPDGSTVIYSVTGIDLKSEARQTNIYKTPITGGETLKLTTEGGSSPQWFGNGKKIAFIRGGDLYTMNSDGSGQKKVDGLSDFEIFSISPANDRILFTRRVKLDQTANEKHGLPKAKVRIIDDLMYRHWNYWSDYSYSHVFVASFTDGSVSGEKDIMEGQKFESPLSPYFDEAEITWSPDGRYIAYTTKRLRGKEDALSTNSDIFLYDISTGNEINISAGNMGYDRNPVFSPDGSKIAYQSMERDGYESDLDRLFVYDIPTGKRAWITEGWTFDVSAINWSDDATLFFSCAHLGTLKIFRTNLTDREIVEVAGGNYDLSPVSLKSGILVAQQNSMSMAPELVTVDINTGEVRHLSSINKAIYESVKMGEVSEKYIRTKDGKDLQMWVIYPPDFDASKKYPALLFCLGGPQSALTQFWSYRWNFQMMAANGYIVYAPNRRGVAGFGQEWKEQISGDYGGLNMQDYLDATDAMAREPYVDASRMGAVGASYGGYSVFYLAGIHEKRFKAFISHCGVFNFVSEYGSTEEMWFPNKDYEGPYWENHKSYKFSPHLLVRNWDTPIMIITGANDFRIPYTQSLEAFQAARLRDIPARLLFFEDECHWVLKPQNAVIWQREFFEWLDAWLK